MASRKNNDILTDVLTGGASDGSLELDELSRFLQQQQPPTNSAGKWPDHVGAGKKKKVTHYLTPEILERLERVMPEIDRLFPVGNGRPPSRSALLEAAVRIVVQDFEHQREYSLLAQWLQNKS
ncbi:hypothetical protein [Desulfurivibrio alkaliphilus]|uniref:Uncharacterized protein n=1 Tax=Desulfurivibrio alkaliphilus (strain DSM 19089 / UNIQEM U267 / AHT2) TaxID=589865 RepID=D6Z1W1_DESAT|nr:hypothetical protein [Desulfurivibrio alkaliphilus]ADH85536.1 hypothetical protein DaAHT2_0832 [Desulfurivibrio alkaliphilus AHT 2]